jgi:acetoin utilization deacetylase AcuC-like enzyme
MKTGLIYDPIYLEHDTGEHPENARRLTAIISHLTETGLMPNLALIRPRAASEDELRLVHSREHISKIEQQSRRGGYVDADTAVSPASYQVARYAAGGVLSATDAVMNGEIAGAFALVRPPGHHATPARAMGFCLFNNVAIAARYALSRCELQEIAIIDFDVHHGNGIQQIFYDDPRVLYISTHEYPFYPGSGSITETGQGEGRGSTINIPLPAGCSDAEYRRVFSEIVVPGVSRFQPQLILVSAGYDAHWADELALMRMSITGFARIVADIRQLAHRWCHDHLIFSLEGGYCQEALAGSVKATLDVLLDETSIEEPLGTPPSGPPPPDITPLVAQIKQVHHLD